MESYAMGWLLWLSLLPLLRLLLLLLQRGRDSKTPQVKSRNLESRKTNSCCYVEQVNSLGQVSCSMVRPGRPGGGDGAVTGNSYVIFGEIVRPVQPANNPLGRQVPIYRSSIVPLSFRKPPSPIDHHPSIGPRREVRNLV